MVYRYVRYVVQIAVQRDVGNLFWNVIVPLTVLSLLGVTPFASSIDGLEDRIGACFRMPF